MLFGGVVPPAPSAPAVVPGVVPAEVEGADVSVDVLEPPAGADVSLVELQAAARVIDAARRSAVLRM